MILESREKSHGKEERSATWDIFEAVFQRGTVPGASGIAALADRIYLPQMWLSSRIPAVQRAISVSPMPPSSLGDGGDSTAQNPYAADAVFFGVLFCEPGRGISAVQLAAMLGTTYKTAWFMLRRIRIAMGQRDETHQLCGVIEFDDAYFSGPTTGKKRGRGTEKTKVFVALSLDEQGNPRFLKMRVTPNIKQVSVRKFAHAAFANGSEILSDGYCSYIPALKNYAHEYQPYDPDSGLLRWLHIVISNAKAFILGTYHGLSKKYFQSYLDEYSFRFCRRDFGVALLERLTLAVSLSHPAEQKR